MALTCLAVRGVADPDLASDLIHDSQDVERFLQGHLGTLQHPSPEALLHGLDLIHKRLTFGKIKVFRDRLWFLSGIGKIRKK